MAGRRSPVGSRAPGSVVDDDRGTLRSSCSPIACRSWRCPRRFRPRRGLVDRSRRGGRVRRSDHRHRPGWRSSRRRCRRRAHSRRLRHTGGRMRRRRGRSPQCRHRWPGPPRAMAMACSESVAMLRKNSPSSGKPSSAMAVAVGEQVTMPFATATSSAPSAVFDEVGPMIASTPAGRGPRLPARRSLRSAPRPGSGVRRRCRARRPPH